ncbi:Calmodulin, flagellar [Eufriesea mexicana]|uniref:Calmodulin, flagellar n=1 Tax=Eufriesea mexicana TaxID=516756 RepID=A0A310SQH6_9HYME|nr:Calmodulin, flagellar [Eufriesea mexicana]
MELDGENGVTRSTLGNVHSGNEKIEEVPLKYAVFDSKDSGTPVDRELQAMPRETRGLIYREVEDMIKEVDVDGDGRIDFYEFVHALGEPGIDDDEEDEEEEVLSPGY